MVLVDKEQNKVLGFSVLRFKEFMRRLKEKEAIYSHLSKRAKNGVKKIIDGTLASLPLEFLIHPTLSFLHK